MNMELVEKILIAIGAISAAFSSIALITPNKTDDKVATKLQKFGSFMSVLGFDPKLLFKKK